MVKAWIRRLLGLDKISERLRNIDETLDDHTDTIFYELRGLARLIRTHEQALARIIAKIDPIYVSDELDPKRKVESDRLAREVINKLTAEDWARRHSEGDPESIEEAMKETLAVYDKASVTAWLREGRPAATEHSEKSMRAWIKESREALARSENQPKPEEEKP
jgi:hypothetical protein